MRKTFQVVQLLFREYIWDVGIGLSILLGIVYAFAFGSKVIGLAFTYNNQTVLNIPFGVLYLFFSNPLWALASLFFYRKMLQKSAAADTKITNIGALAIAAQNDGQASVDLKSLLEVIGLRSADLATLAQERQKEKEVEEDIGQIGEMRGAPGADPEAGIVL